MTPKKNQKYESLIVMVPDPVESQFAGEFDATLEAIQRAFEARGFFLHNSWLPWPHAGERLRKPLHRQYPGVMLFRNSNADLETGYGGLIVVWLVGETPTIGIHKASLESALNFTRSGGWFPNFDKEPVRIVGPWSSASSVQLPKTLRDWEKSSHPLPPDPRGKQPINFRVISGGATGLERQHFNGKHLGAPINLSTTQHSTEVVLRSVQDFLGKPKVAWFRETNTRFGLWNPAIPDPGIKQFTEPVFPFPVSISRLKRDLEKAFESGESHTRLRPDFVIPKHSDPDRDLIRGLPFADRSESVIAAAEYLRDAVRAIDRSDVRFVGIVGSDPRDVVFLNKLLHRHCPRVRVFTTEPSIAFLHPDESYHMRGVIVGSTYPLAPENQRWVHGDAGRKVYFPSYGTQGIYNAILAHAAESAEAGKKMYGEPDVAKSLLEYQPPFEMRTTPPVWVSVVGQNGEFIPLKCQSSSDADGSLWKNTSPVSQSKIPPRQIKYGFAGLTCLCIVCVGL